MYVNETVYFRKTRTQYLDLQKVGKERHYIMHVSLVITETDIFVCE